MPPIKTLGLRSSLDHSEGVSRTFCASTDSSEMALYVVPSVLLVESVVKVQYRIRGSSKV